MEIIRHTVQEVGQNHPHVDRGECVAKPLRSVGSYESVQAGGLRCWLCGRVVRVSSNNATIVS